MTNPVTHPPKRPAARRRTVANPFKACARAFDVAQIGRGHLVLGDCLAVMKRLPDYLVMLAVTSPS